MIRQSAVSVHASAREAARIASPPPSARIVLLPPVTHAAGAEFAAWAFMIVDKLHPGMKFAIPRTGAALDHIVRFFLDTGHGGSLALAPPEQGTEEMLRGATLALFTPMAPASSVGVCAAIRGRTPLVLSTACRLARELTAAGAWLCPPANPQATAAALLTALENPGESAHRAAHAAEWLARRDEATSVAFT